MQYNLNERILSLQEELAEQREMILKVASSLRKMHRDEVDTKTHNLPKE